MITYVNKIDDVLQGIEDLIETEFSFPVSYDDHRGNESILLIPISDELLDYNSASQTREYTVNVEYELVQNGQMNYDHLTKRAERIKRLLTNNSTNGTKWYNGRNESIEYQQDDDEQDKKRAVITFSCNITEVY
jgi:hypothetical protein